VIFVDPKALPVRPPSEVEWEDLLVRLEIAPRALRIAVEEAPADHPDLLDLLRLGVMAEAVLREQLESMIDGRPVLDGIGVESVPDDTASLVAEIGRLRYRNFLMVQRRGINVWEWTLQGGGMTGVTSYQLFQAAAKMDGVLLDSARRAARGEDFA
jgi:hypothetical protein